MAWATSVPTASLLAAPVTLVWGPITAFNALTLLAHPLAGLGGFLLLQEVAGVMLASLVGGFLFGFSGYENGQVLGHLNLDLVFLLPLLVLLAVLRARGRLGRRLFVMLMALTLAAQFGLSSEVFATAVLSGGLLLVGGLGVGDRRRAAGLMVECGWALAGAVLLVLPMLISMQRHAHEMPEFLNPPSVYSNDLLNLIVPTRAELLHGALTERIVRRFTGNGEEQDLYLGLPLLVIVALSVRRASGWRMAALVATGVLAVASLGPALQVGGSLTGVLLPWWLPEHLPLLRGALPCRLGVYVALGASVAAGLWIAERPGWARLGAGLLACACLLPGWARQSWTRAEVPCLFSGEQASRVLDGGALLLPFTSGDTMLWQAVSGMDFVQVGGVLSFIPLAFQHEPVMLSLERNEAGGGFAAELAALVRRHGVRHVVLGPGTGGSIRAALDATGWRRREVCGAEIVDVGAAEWRQPSVGVTSP